MAAERNSIMVKSITYMITFNSIWRGHSRKYLCLLLRSLPICTFEAHVFSETVSRSCIRVIFISGNKSFISTGSFVSYFHSITQFSIPFWLGDVVIRWFSTVFRNKKGKRRFMGYFFNNAACLSTTNDIFLVFFGVIRESS